MLPLGPGSALGVNGVLTEDATAAIKMQITRQNRPRPESALHESG